MTKIIFLNAYVKDDRVVFIEKEEHDATKKKTEWLVKGMPQNLNGTDGLYHLKNSDFNIAWSHTWMGFSYTAFIWCEKRKLNEAKKKCVDELIRTTTKMKKAVLNGEKKINNYKKEIDFLLALKKKKQ